MADIQAGSTPRSFEQLCFCLVTDGENRRTSFHVWQLFGHDLSVVLMCHSPYNLNCDLQSQLLILTILNLQIVFGLQPLLLPLLAMFD